MHAIALRACRLLSATTVLLGMPTVACGGEGDRETESPPVPEATATLDIPTVTCSPTSASSSQAQLRFGPDPFCASWRDQFSDESGFKVVLRYPKVGSTFEHTVGPNQTALIFPAEESPSSGDPSNCDRSVFMIELSVLRNGVTTPYDAVTFQTECLSE
jgi:hypothetical protein